MVLKPIKYLLNEARLEPVMLQKCVATKWTTNSRPENFQSISRVKLICVCFRSSVECKRSRLNTKVNTSQPIAIKESINDGISGIPRLAKNLNQLLAVTRERRRGRSQPADRGIQTSEPGGCRGTETMHTWCAWWSGKNSPRETRQESGEFRPRVEDFPITVFKHLISIFMMWSWDAYRLWQNLLIFACMNTAAKPIPSSHIFHIVHRSMKRKRKISMHSCRAWRTKTSGLWRAPGVSHVPSSTLFVTAPTTSRIQFSKRRRDWGDNRLLTNEAPAPRGSKHDLRINSAKVETAKRWFRGF